MKARLGIVVAALTMGLSSMAMAMTPEPGTLENGTVLNFTFANVDTIYTFPSSTVWSGDVDLLDTSSHVFEVVRFIPEASNAAHADSAILYSTANIPAVSLPNTISINADFIDGITTYVACHCDTFYIPTPGNSVPSVPLPASAATGGAGLLAVMFGCWIKSRKAAIA
jgi:hypothetical protein